MDSSSPCFRDYVSVMHHNPKIAFPCSGFTQDWSCTMKANSYKPCQNIPWASCCRVLVQSKSRDAMPKKEVTAWYEALYYWFSSSSDCAGLQKTDWWFLKGISSFLQILKLSGWPYFCRTIKVQKQVGQLALEIFQKPHSLTISLCCTKRKGCKAILSWKVIISQ